MTEWPPNSSTAPVSVRLSQSHLGTVMNSNDFTCYYDGHGAPYWLSVDSIAHAPGWTLCSYAVSQRASVLLVVKFHLILNPLSGCGRCHDSNTFSTCQSVCLCFSLSFCPFACQRVCVCPSVNQGFLSIFDLSVRVSFCQSTQPSVCPSVSIHLSVYVWLLLFMLDLYLSASFVCMTFIIHARICLFIKSPACVCPCLCVYVRVCMSVFVCLCVCMYVSSSVYMPVSLYVNYQ